MKVEQIVEAIRQLTPTDRLRLVQWVVQDAAQVSAAPADPASIIGMMADEPEVMDEAYRLGHAARLKSAMRLSDG